MGEAMGRPLDFRVAQTPWLLGPDSLAVQGQAALGQGGEGALHLTHFRIRKGGSEHSAALRGWEEWPCPRHSVPCTEVALLGRWGGVRSPRVIANSREGGGGESWWQGRGG